LLEKVEFNIRTIIVIAKKSKINLQFVPMQLVSLLIFEFRFENWFELVGTEFFPNNEEDIATFCEFASDLQLGAFRRALLHFFSYHFNLATLGSGGVFYIISDFLITGGDDSMELELDFSNELLSIQIVLLILVVHVKNLK